MRVSTLGVSGHLTTVAALLGVTSLALAAQVNTASRATAGSSARSSAAPTGEFDFSRDGRELFAAKPDNIFLVKMNWWLSR